MNTMENPQLEKTMMVLNVIALYLVLFVLVAAFYAQFSLNELPCPLCLLQRIALALMAAGLIYNLKFGTRARGYGLILLAAAFGGAVAVRQVLLHIAPGDPGYGSPVLGLHYYTWSAIVFAIAIVTTAIVLLIDKPLRADDMPRPLPRLAVVAIWIAVVVTFAEAANALIECGFNACPSDPVSYDLLPSAL